MPTIVFATDFSPSAQNALTFAAELAQTLGAALDLVHAYVIPFAYTDSPVPLLNVDEIRTITDMSMDAETIRVKGQFPDLAVSNRILPGDAYEVLLEIARSEAPMMIVLGTSGAGLGSLFWGSLAVKALRSLPVPVLAVPSDNDFRPVRHLCYAADYAEVSSDMPFDKIRQWVHLLSAHVSVLHIDQPEKVLPVPEILRTQLEDLQPQYYSIQHEDMVEGVNQFLREKAVDWLLVVPRQYGFLENLFHKSRTRLLAAGSNVPVLALHPLAGS